MQLVQVSLALAACLGFASGARINRKAKDDMANYSGYVVLRAEPTTQSQIDLLSEESFERASIEVDFWNSVTMMFKGSAVAKAKKFLDAVGIAYQTTISDVQEVIEETTPTAAGHGGVATAQAWCTTGTVSDDAGCCPASCGKCGGAGCSRRPGGGYACCTSAFTKPCESPTETRCNIPAPGGFLGDYHRFDEITDWMESAAAAEVAASMIQIGATHEGRMIKGLKINLAGGAKRPIIFVLCGIHAREWVSPAACLFAADKLMKGQAGSGAEKFEWHIVPSSNADGYEYTHTKDRMWRATRSTKDSRGCTGVDPNRNWDFKHCQESNEKRCGQSYCGTEPFSESEVSNVAEYLQGLQSSGQDVQAFLDIHAFSQFWMWPWGYTKGQADDEADMARCGNAGAAALKAVHGKQFRTGSIANTIYQVGGSSVDWVYDALGIKYAYALELRDTGMYGFLLPSDQIIPTGEELTAGLVGMANCMSR